MNISKNPITTERPLRRTRARSPLYAQITQPPVLLALLALAFGAGLLLARMPAAPAATALSPLAPPIPSPSPTPPPTPTPTSPETGGVLDTMYIDIEPQDFAQLAAQREEALRLGVILPENTSNVPATLRLGQQEMRVDVGLKGDWAFDHLSSDKWSLRIRTKGSTNYVYGMRVFAIQDPSMRSYLNEWLFLENVRQEGVLGVGYRFVRVVLNGEYRGIYAVEAGFSRELIETSGHRMGLMLRYDEDLMWRYRAYYDDQLIPVGANDFHIVDDYAPNASPGMANFDAAYAAQRDAAFGMLRAVWNGERPASDVFDLETMGRFLALSDLWCAPHGLIWHNLRYYYNPFTTRLEPIAFNNDALQGDLSRVGLLRSAYSSEPALWYSIFYDDPQLQAAYVKELWRISQPGYVEELEAQLGPQYEALRAEMEPEFGAEVLAPPWDMLRQRRALIREILNPLQTVYAYVQRPQAELTSTVDIDVGNLLELPLQVVGLEVGDTLLPVSNTWVDRESAAFVAPATVQDPDALILRAADPQATEAPYVHLHIPTSAFPGAPITNTEEIPALQIVTRLWGLTTTVTSTVLPGYPPPLADGPLPEIPTVEQALAQHPYLQRVAGENTLTIPAGTWTITGNLILPVGYGLRLGPGTTLRFGPMNYLFASGPLDFQGSEDAPIVLQPSEDQWQGIVVLEAGAPSTWTYTTVERAFTIRQPSGWSLTAAVTFYRSDIRMEHCHIVDALGEDGVGIISARVEAIQTEIGPVASDALDIMAGHGLVEGCVIHDTGADGVDVKNGTEVEVRDTRFVNIGDKGMSIGEHSYATARNITVENADFGMASKDLSQIVVEDATIVGARIAGLATYIKKPEYGTTASIIANRITFVDIPPERYTLVQTGCWIDLDGTRIWGTDIDVDALYTKWIGWKQ
jgi:hypothetical protein